MIKPEDVVLPEALVEEHASKIAEGLKIGTVGFRIPINYRLLEALKAKFPDWCIGHKEYANSIKISFSVKQTEFKVEIKKHE